MAGTLLGGTFGCGMNDQGKLPGDVEDPAVVLTPTGALGRYRATVDSVPWAVDDAVFWTNALPSDEVATAPSPVGTSSGYTATDSRQDWADLGGAADRVYLELNQLRIQAHEARGLLAKYVPDSLPALRGHLYALEGYGELFLADAYCSGIPLSTVDVDADYTLAPGSTTAEVYTHAKLLFDTAMGLSIDSLRLAQLAALGRGRALLALGDYAGAAAAVAAVPDDYRYQVTLPWPATTRSSYVQAIVNEPFSDGGGLRPNLLTMGDRQGLNGLDFVSSQDPRIPAHARGPDGFGNTIYYPDSTKYPRIGPVTHTLASGIEARLIEAEAALASGNVEGWLTRLNRLRTDGTYDVNGSDTLWHAGTGNMAGLKPLDDPGSTAARVDLLFRERGFWLYLTAHRLGDLRRLVRQYGRNPETVFPTGFYAGGIGVYGRAVVIPVPASEQKHNPYYTGCINFNA